MKKHIRGILALVKHRFFFILLILLIIPVSAALIQENKNKDYRNSYEKFFIFMSIGASSKDCIKSNENFLDYLINWLLSNFETNVKIKNNADIERYVKGLDNRLIDLVADFDTGKCKIGSIKLKDYRSRIEAVQMILGNNAFKGTHNFMEKKILLDFQILNKAYQSMKTEDKLLINSIIEMESKIGVKNKGIKEIAAFTDKCDSLLTPLKFTCYRSVLEVNANKSKEEVFSLLNTIKAKKDNGVLSSVECHFLNHEIGFFLGKSYGTNGMYKCPDTFDECSFGCYHGIAEYLHFDNYAYFWNESAFSAKKFNITNQSSDTFESFTLSHGFGHAFEETYGDLKIAQSKCDLLAKKNSKYDLLCYWGVAHEFFLQELYTNKSFELASRYCDFFKKHKIGCHYMLALTYSEANYSKIFKSCKRLSTRGCYDGVGAYIDIAASRANLQKAVVECKAISESGGELDYCLRGIMTSSIYFLNNFTRAFSVCAMNISIEKECYISFQYVYNTTWVNSSIDYCEYVGKDSKGLCKTKTREFGVY